MIYEQTIELARLSDGESGQSSFIHIKYSNDKKTFTGNDGEDVGIYLGIYTDDIEEDSMDFNKYKWSKIVGADGKQGEDGVSITTIDEHYAVSSSNTAEPTSWTDTVPEMTNANKYLWNYETIHYSNDTTSDTKKRVIGVYGDTGDDGTSITVKSTKVTYGISDNTTTKPTSWSETIPAAKAEQYLWTKSITTYSDEKSIETYSYALQGKTGTKGDKGDDGTSVNVESTTITYGTSTNSATKPTSWSSTMPTVAQGEYLWTKTVVAYSDGKSTETYTFALQGKNGSSGSNGKSIGTITNYYLATSASSNVTTSTSGWTTTVQNVSADKKYLWNYEVIKYSDNTVASTSTPCIIGAYGDKGNTGATGTGIESITKEFYLSTSKTTQTGGSWQTTMPTWTTGKYIWTREKIVYKNPASTVYTEPSCDTGWEAANEVDKKVTTLQTDFKVEQGKITELIKETTIDNSDGTTSSLKDKYLDTVKTVDGNTTTIANIKTDVNTNTNNIKSMDSRITEIKQTADGVTTTVTANKSKWDKASTDASSAVSTANAASKTASDASTNASNALSKANDIVTKANNGDFDGRGVKSTAVEYQASTSGTTAPTGTWSTAIPSVANGSYLWTRTTITYTSGNPSVSYSVARMGVNGAKGDKGDNGKDGTNGTSVTVKSTSVTYGVSTNSSTKPTSWTTTIPTATAGQYLWTKTITTYSDGKSAETYSYALQGVTGAKGDKGVDGTNGKGISSIVHHYLASSSSSNITTSTSGWQTTPQAVTSTNKYLWYYQTINYTTGSPTNTTPAIIGVYGDKGSTGSTGKGISSVTPQYYLSTSNTTQTGGSWKTTQDTWSSGKYYWTRDSITWSDSTTTTTTPMLATGLNNANSVASTANSTANTAKSTADSAKSTATSAQTIANQTASKFSWIVKSGTSATDFTLTDRTAELVAENINLNGRVTFKGLNSDTQTKINDANNTLAASQRNNLIVNGFGELGNNTNFSAWHYVNPSLTKDCQTTTFSYAGLSSSKWLGERLIPVNLNNRYNFSMNVKSLETGNKMYLGFAEIDIDSKEIQPYMQMALCQPTTLAKDLKDGDTVVYFNTLKDFSAVATETHRLGLIFWNYKDSTGYQYPAGTYSRNAWMNLYLNTSIDKTNNCITLKSAWNHGTFPAGTQVSQSNSSGYKYFDYLNKELPTTFTKISHTIGGIQQPYAYDSNAFNPATKSIYFIILHNYGGSSSKTTCINSVQFTEYTIQSIIDNWAKDAVVSGETVINGGYIQANTIKTDQLAVDNIFATGSSVMNIINAQQIDASRITAGQLNANHINAYGLTITNKNTKQQTFDISTDGEVTMRGSVSSYDYNVGKTGWTINNDGTAEFNDIVARGSVITNDGGIVSSGGSGKNLLLNSSFENSLDNWTGANYTITSESGYKCAKVEGALTTTKTLTQSVFSRIKKDTTTHYTISAWVKLVNYKAGTKDPFCALYFDGGYNNNGTSTFLGSTTISGSNNIIPQNGKGWQYISYTFRFAQVPTYMNFQVYTRDFTGTLYIRDVKLEEGDVATAWSAAEDDKTKQVRFWAGSSYEERDSAPFIVYNDGSIRATQGEYSGLWTGDIKIGNISIVDPSSSSGNDALVTIQNGSNGIKKVQLSDGNSSTFAQDLIISNNSYGSMITLKQDGSAVFSKGINIGDNVTLNSSSLFINNKELTTSSTGFLMNGALDVGSNSKSANLTVHGNTISDNITLSNELNFGGVVKFTKMSNGINIDFVG